MMNINPSPGQDPHFNQAPIFIGPIKIMQAQVLVVQGVPHLLPLDWLYFHKESAEQAAKRTERLKGYGAKSKTAFV